MGIRNRIKEITNEYTSLSHYVAYHGDNFRETFKGVKMQDRFKFRVWNKENKKLYDWDFLEKTKGEDCTLFWCLNQAQNDFKHNILLQCTGLKDKNGNLIFEGDLVKVNNKTIAIIQYYRGMFGCRFDKEKEDFTRFLGVGAYSDDEIEVIGNIYETPELLESGGEA